MKQSIDPVFEFDERSIIGEVAHDTFDVMPLRVLLCHEFPRVDLDLLHTERDLLLVLLDVEDHNFEFFTSRHNLARVIDSPGPRHF